jgi:signal transduction histidine kinase
VGNNAVTRGDPSSPIAGRAETAAGSFVLSVTNRGPTIPPEVVENTFQPFVRGRALPGQQGLGLGLYIASEIARAQRDTLTVTSGDGDTCFTFEMPLTGR